MTNQDLDVHCFASEEQGVGEQGHDLFTMWNAMQALRENNIWEKHKNSEYLYGWQKGRQNTM